MNELNGYIKVNRSFLNWEWHDDQSMVTVFLHCLLLANWKRKKWHGRTIERGSFVTSTVSLADVCGLSPNTVRRCLKRLQDTGELLVKTSNKGTVITVNNYAKYQEQDKPENSAVQNVTHNLHNNLHNNLHTTEEYKNKRRDTKKYIKKVRKEEILPDYYDANPVRNPEPVPATPEEVEKVRQLLRQGKANEP